MSEDWGPDASAWNKTAETVVVSYRYSSGALSGYRMELSAGQQALVIGPFQFDGQSGCLRGTLVATREGRAVAELAVLCADETWEILERDPSSSPSPT